ncbi:MAG: hypothetical protein IT447_14790 [Phycisphaerales bacterium]|nr:hypothetical protein [Phycisphaerales bacterium]
MGTAQVDGGLEWPAELDFILSALEAGQSSRHKQRSMARKLYRVKAALRLFADGPLEPRALFTRDVSRRSLGFVTQHQLPLGYGGILELPAPDGRLLRIDCTLLRCREAVRGWFEGAVYFNREQFGFGLIP